MWNPFRKKSFVTIGAKPIYHPGFFAGFGSSSVQFKKIFEASQNNDLLILYFNTLAEVAAPVLKYADGAAQVTLDTQNEEVKKLLSKPNYYQGFNEFFSLLALHKRLFGESIIDASTSLKLGQEEKKPNSLFVWSPQFTSIKLKDEKDFRINNIDKYIFDSKEMDRNILSVDPDKILHLKEVNPNFKRNQYLFGESRYAGAYRNIESIIEGYGAKVNLYKDGPQLIITGKGQGEFASTSSRENIKNVQDAMKKYGMSKGKYRNLITDVPLDVKNASLNVAQMQILQNNQSDFDRLCDAQGINSKIFSKDTKFEDAESALSDFYNNSFRSEIDGITRDFQTYLQRWWPDLDDLTPDYSQISEIVQANNQEAERLLRDAEKGLITRNEYLEAIGKETRKEKEFNELYFLTATGWVPLTQNTSQNEE